MKNNKLNYIKKDAAGVEKFNSKWNAMLKESGAAVKFSAVEAVAKNQPGAGLVYLSGVLSYNDEKNVLKTKIFTDYSTKEFQKLLTDTGIAFPQFYTKSEKNALMGVAGRSDDEREKIAKEYINEQYAQIKCPILASLIPGTDFETTYKNAVVEKLRTADAVADAEKEQKESEKKENKKSKKEIKNENESLKSKLEMAVKALMDATNCDEETARRTLGL